MVMRHWIIAVTSRTGMVVSVLDGRPGLWSTVVAVDLLLWWMDWWLLRLVRRAMRVVRRVIIGKVVLGLLRRQMLLGGGGSSSVWVVHATGMRRIIFGGFVGRHVVWMLGW